MPSLFEMPKDLKKLSLEDLTSLVKRLIDAQSVRDSCRSPQTLSGEGPTRLSATTMLAELDDRLDATTDAKQKGVLFDLQFQLREWLSKDDQDSNRGRFGGACMCSTLIGEAERE
jgi:hypothetical protein